MCCCVAGDCGGSVPPDANHHAGLPTAELYVQRVCVHSHHHAGGVHEGAGPHRGYHGRHGFVGETLRTTKLLRQVQVSSHPNSISSDCIF